MREDKAQKLRDLFAKPVFQAGTKPLKNGIEIALFVDEHGPLCLTKVDGVATLGAKPPKNPDMTFWVPSKALVTLLALETEDVGQVGVEIIKLMMHDDPAFRMKAKVHIGLLSLLGSGYLAVLPLGGATVMKYLASRGFGGMGKIKEAISKLKD